MIRRVGHTTINLPTKFEVSNFTRYRQMKVVANCRKCQAMSTFNRVHTTSYLSLTETMRLSCIVSEIQRAIRRNSATYTYHTCIWWPCWGLPSLNFEKNWQSTWTIMWHCLSVPMPSHCSRRPTCDRHTHTQTDTQTQGHAIAYNMLSRASTIKTLGKFPASYCI